MRELYAQGYSARKIEELNLLPGRTAAAILARANRIGLSLAPEFKEQLRRESRRPKRYNQWVDIDAETLEQRKAEVLRERTASQAAPEFREPKTYKVRMG